MTGRHLHLYTLTYTRRRRDWFRKRYWLRCFECDIKAGPYYDEETARGVLRIHIRNLNGGD